MKKNFTLIEMLAVIAIIAVLAGLLMPAINKARAKSRTTSCLSNQNQTAKTISMYINDYKGLFSSGQTNATSWAKYLYDGDYIQQDMKSYRCVALSYPDDSLTNVGSDSFDGYKYAFGVAYTKASKDVFDFRGSRYFKAKVGTKKIRIAPSQIMLGGCAAKKGSTDGQAVMDFTAASDTLGIPVAIHDSACNFFFYDGHAGTQKQAEASHFYYPNNEADSDDQISVRFNSDLAEI